MDGFSSRRHDFAASASHIPDAAVRQFVEELERHEATLEHLIAEASSFPMEVMAHLQAALFTLRYQATPHLNEQLGLSGLPSRTRHLNTEFWEARHEVSRLRGLLDDAFQAIPTKDRKWETGECGYAETFQEVWDEHREPGAIAPFND